MPQFVGNEMRPCGMRYASFTPNTMPYMVSHTENITVIALLFKPIMADDLHIK